MPTVKVRNNKLEAALRVFKKKNAEKVWEYRERRYYVPASERRRLAKQAAVRRRKRDDSRN